MMNREFEKYPNKNWDHLPPLQKGYGTPRVRVMNLAKEEIVMSDGHPLGSRANDFKYEFDEENGNSCKVVFESDNPYFLDNPYLRLGRGIYVQWGYLASNSASSKESFIRKVIIKDISANYMTTGVTATIYCKDFADHYKEIKTRISKESSLVDYLGDLAKAGMSVDIIRDNTLIKRVGYAETDRYKVEVNEQGLVTPLGGFGSASDNARFERWLEVPRPIVEGSSNPDLVTRQLLTVAPGGPYIIDTDNDKVVIKNRNFNQPVFRLYGYKEPVGDLISFRPFTENDGRDPSEIKADFYNDLDKKYDKLTSLVSEKVNPDGDGDTENPLTPYDEVLNAPDGQLYTEYSTPDLTNYFGTIDDQTKEQIFNILTQYKEKYGPGKTIDPQVAREFITEKLVVQGYFKGGESVLERRHAIDGIGEALGLWQAEIHMVTGLDIISDEAEEDFEEDLKNTLKKLSQKRYQADITVIGDPHLRTGILVRIAGVARLSSGNYYITKCTHHISVSNGYKVSMKGLLSTKETELLNIRMSNTITEDGKVKSLISDSREKISNLSAGSTKENDENLVYAPNKDIEEALSGNYEDPVEVVPTAGVVPTGSITSVVSAEQDF